jgi:hypothetical protein
VNNELETMLKEAVVACYKVSFQDLPEEAEKNYEKVQLG